MSIPRSSTAGRWPGWRRYVPRPDQNRMRSTGDVAAARARIDQPSEGNLRALLEQRFGWMNEHIGPGDEGLEVGCGAAFSARYLACRRLVLTDYADHDFLDAKWVSAEDLPFDAASFDFVLACNVLHHLEHPLRLFDEARRVLRPAGRLILFEPHASLAMKLVLRATHHEGFDFTVDVFDRAQPATNADDPWIGNNAVARLMFDDHEAFLRAVPGWRIVRDERCEFLLFLNSGGVTSRTVRAPLPNVVNRAIARLDGRLARVAPNLLALGRRIVLERR